MMRNRLRALERLFACQRGEVIVEPIVEEFVEQWADALDGGNPLPDPIDLAQKAIKHGVPVLTTTPLNSYLAQCKRDDSIPEAQRITQTIIHGFLEMRMKTRCACGYHA
jgi:hypothetical protein